MRPCNGSYQTHFGSFPSGVGKASFVVEISVNSFFLSFVQKKRNIKVSTWIMLLNYQFSIFQSKANLLIYTSNFSEFSWIIDSNTWTLIYIWSLQFSVKYSLSVMRVVWVCFLVKCWFSYLKSSVFESKQCKLLQVYKWCSM